MEITPLSFLHGHSFLIAWTTDTFIHAHHRCRYVSVRWKRYRKYVVQLQWTLEKLSNKYVWNPHLQFCREWKSACLSKRSFDAGFLLLLPEQLFLFWKTESIFSCKIHVKNRKWGKYMQMAGWYKSVKNMRRNHRGLKHCLQTCNANPVGSLHFRAPPRQGWGLGQHLNLESMLILSHLAIYNQVLF